ncbi:MAG TPA: hypothetical protein VGJ26_16835 [Pirellulales bacterium]|jgi:hypothetical protein
MARKPLRAVGRLAPLVVMFFCAVLSAHLRAQQPATSSGETIRVARLVTELGADSFAVRKRATDELAKIGPEARQAIEEATRSEDPEVRLRAKDLLREIKIRDLWSASRFIAPPGEARPAADILKLLGEQTGNHVMFDAPYGALTNAPVKLDVTPAEYWPALDEICRQSANHPRHHYDTRAVGMAVVSGAPGRHPLAYAGPVRGRITSARRAFIEEMSYEEARSETSHTFQLNVEMTWEDRFKLVAYRASPEVLAATTDTGVTLNAAQPAAGGWNVTGVGSRQALMNIRLQPPPARARELETLRLAWELIAVGDFTHLDVEDLASREPRFQDDVELVIESFQPTTGGRYEVVVRMRRNLTAPDPAEAILQEHDLELIDAAGTSLRKLNQSGALADHGATIKATFLAANETSPPQKLRFTYPRLRSQRNLEIIFRHVPLPTGLPE